MALTKADREEIAEIITTAVSSSMREMAPACGLLPKDTQDEIPKFMPHFMGMVKDIGHGDYAHGIETLRVNLKTISGIRTVSSQFMTRVVAVLAAGLTGAIIWCLINGAHAWAKLKGWVE